MTIRVAHSALTCLVLLLLAACQPANLSDQDPAIGHPVGAEEKTLAATFDLPADGAISPMDADRLRRLAAESVRRGVRAVSLTAYAKPGETGPVQAYAEQMAAVLRQAGATANVGVQESPTMTTNGAVAVQVPVWSAIVPECGTYKRGMNPDYDNAPNSNWGCSLQRNRALMVVNPADLVRARESTGRDAARSADVIGKYERGEATSSTQENTRTGSTSGVAH